MNLKYLWDDKWKDLDDQVVKCIIRDTGFKPISEYEDEFVKYYECENSNDSDYRGTRFLLIIRDFDKEGVNLEKFMQG